jgi:hypothetical protein
LPHFGQRYDDKGWKSIAFERDTYEWGLTTGLIGTAYEIKNVLMQYLRIRILDQYKDPRDDQFTQGIRDIKIIMESNLARFTRTAGDDLPPQNVVASSVWDYPPDNLVNNPYKEFAKLHNAREVLIGPDEEPVF